MKQQRGKSFLERFEGKRATISKQGLINLLQKQKAKQEGKKEVKKEIQSMGKYEWPKQRYSAIQLFSQLSPRKLSYNETSNEQRTSMARETEQPTFKQRLSYPDKSNKDEKLNKYIFKQKENPEKKASQLTSRTEILRGKKNQQFTLPRLQSSWLMQKKANQVEEVTQFKLDHVALEHLQMLNRFQIQLQKLRSKRNF